MTVIRILSCVLAIAFSAHAGAERAVVFRTQTMGTWATLKLVTADSASVADLAYEALLELHRVDSLMSNWTDTSELARINREAGHGRVAVHPEVARVLAAARDIGRESDGAFDVTVEPLVRLWGFLGGEPHLPDENDVARELARVGWDKLRFDADAATLSFARDDVRVDFGGIAKGYGVDQVAVSLRATGVKNALVDLSGNMAAIGNAPAREGWVVGIRDPAGRTDYLARLRLHDQAVATSGDYEQFVAADGKRYGHILDPRTGYSARGLVSVTVVAPAAMTADAWATALFVLGPDEARRVARKRRDLSVVMVEPGTNGDAILWVESGLRDRIQIVPSATDGVVTVRWF